MEQDVAQLVEGARRLAETAPPSLVEGSEGIRQYQDDSVTVICRGKAVTVYLKNFDDPVLLVSSRGTVLHVEDGARSFLGDRFA